VFWLNLILQNAKKLTFRYNSAQNLFVKWAINCIGKGESLMNNIFRAKPSLGKTLRFTIMLAFLVVALLQTCSILPEANAQATPYGDTGHIALEAIWYKIYGVKVNDQILISVTPAMSTIIFSPNMTNVDAKTGVNAYVAQESGDYILRLVSGSNTSYTLKSSHPITDLQANPTTPYSSNGEIQGPVTTWAKLYGVKQNDLVLISFHMTDYFHTSVLFPNLTVMDGYDVFSPYIDARNFIAPVSGDYAFKFSPPSYSINQTYELKSSHPLTSGITTPPPTPTPTPSQGQTPAPSTSNSVSPTPTPTPTITPLNISVIASGSVTFEVPDSFPSGVQNFTYNFGDGTTKTTSDRTVTHVYETPGNYVFTLKLEGAPEVKVLETYTVTVTSPSENPIIKYTWPIVTSIVAGLSVASILALARRRKK
jgi:hypothetical protein